MLENCYSYVCKLSYEIIAMLTINIVKTHTYNIVLQINFIQIDDHPQINAAPLLITNIKNVTRCRDSRSAKNIDTR